MMVYLAILPQFMDRQLGDTTLQAVMLSAIFMFWCAVVYSAICIVLGRFRGGAGLSDARRRLVDSAAGGMILMAAGFMALFHR
ncbi:hypothetical protein WJ966_00410 [Achromobacter xylosoxidans]